MNMKKVIAAGTIVMLLAACDQQGGGGGGINKSDIGTVVGAGLGGWAGSNVGGGSGNVVATIAGTLIGAGIGREIGGSLDRADLAYHNQTASRALENNQPGQSLPWRNPESGHSGSITPSNYYKTNSGQYCREFTQTINVGGRSQEGYGTACRQPDGTWEIVSN